MEALAGSHKMQYFDSTLQEMETISQVRETLTRSLENAKEQLKASREAKHQERKPLAEIAPEIALSSSFLVYPPPFPSL